MHAGALPASQSASLSTILPRLGSLLLSGPLLAHLFTSLGRLLVGVSIGVTLGTASGMILARVRPADFYLSPTLQFLAGVPVVVWLPLAIVFLGPGEGFKVGLSALATFFLVHVHSYEATSEIARGYLELAAIYEKSSMDRFLHVLLPSTVPALITAVRISVVIGWIVIFFVEYAASFRGTEGLGWFIADARQVGRVEDEFAGMLLLGLTGFSLDAGLARLQRHFSRWSPTDRRIA